MAIILRITSADGKKVMTKTLPALPAVVKVPAGGRADVIDPETKQEVSLARWINDHSADLQRSRGDDAVPGRDYVKVETTDWDSSEAWFASLPAIASAPMAQSDNWYAASSGDEDRDVLGLDLTTVLIGTAVGGAVVFGALELSKNDKPKDKIAPAAPTGLDLATDDDTGTSTTDNATTKTTGLTISGTAEAGSKVELFDGTTSLGTVTAGANGAFSKDVDLAAGAHAITARATDVAGNVSSASTPLVINVDATAPAVPNTLVLAAADDTGVSNSDGITRNFTGLTITGKGDAGSVIELFDGATSLGTATVGTDGNFTKDVVLAEGNHIVTAKATDAAGNASAASAGLGITVDTTAPGKATALDLAAADDNGASNSDNITSQKTGLTITGTAEAGATIAFYDGTATSAFTSATAGADGTFSVDISLATGAHSLTTRVVDVAGNVGALSDPLVITIIDSTTSLIG